MASSSGTVCLRSGSCTSARTFAPRFLQTPPRDDALALRYDFTSIRLSKGLSPSSCRTCSAHHKRKGPDCRSGPFSIVLAGVVTVRGTLLPRGHVRCHGPLDGMVGQSGTKCYPPEVPIWSAPRTVSSPRFRNDESPASRLALFLSPEPTFQSCRRLRWSRSVGYSSRKSNTPWPLKARRFLSSGGTSQSAWRRQRRRKLETAKPSVAG